MNLLNKDDFTGITRYLESIGYADEIKWQREVTGCRDLGTFINETIWVILNSGMKNQIARKIYDRIAAAIEIGQDISEVFGHKGKVAAIKYVMANGVKLFDDYKCASDKLAFLRTIPFIGPITCWHLAKNLGLDVVKPDRHLVRVAEHYKITPDKLCEEISAITGEKKCVVDLIIWRACNIKLITVGVLD